ncbi:MAG: ThiF family adenylyltransferase, partial [Parvibaculum sp.]|nr:ThiF family adenylyltransferase [Parvibaculum sp.]
MALTDEQLERYARHIVLKEIGGPGQRKLLAARVLVIGAGGLGSPCLIYLAAAGAGTIGIIDNDIVSLSNLQRQIAHGMGDIGRAKTESAAEAARRINPDVKI